MAGSNPDGLPAVFRISPGSNLRMMQVKGRTLGSDSRNRGEVMPRRRTRGRPFQRIAEAPRVVLKYLLARLPRDVNVVEEDQVGRAKYERADRGDLVKRRGQV